VKSKTSSARFLAGEGLVVGMTIKEQMQKLLADGYFDEAESALIAVSSRSCYDVRWAGAKFDCWVLSSAVAQELAK
jgi:hypothetical protein